MKAAIHDLQAGPKAIPAMTPLAPTGTGLLQRKCACGGNPGMDGKCEECRKKELGVQRSAIGAASPMAAPPIVHEVLKSPGQPLDVETREFMEPRFGHNFSHVRVHTDAKAMASAQAVNALAYTVGGNVVFGGGQYAPETTQGKRLLAHELTHVVQQSDSGVRSGELALGEATSLQEREAESISARTGDSIAE
ncbi:MAG TPA: DUF4157 domain-containing protein, partial [Gemmataceae bacterium]|nr:DUF4157 domain-containing protein [Gemmataceae bacterium]